MPNGKTVTVATQSALDRALGTFVGNDVTATVWPSQDPAAIPTP